MKHQMVLLAILTFWFIKPNFASSSLEFPNDALYFEHIGGMKKTMEFFGPEMDKDFNYPKVPKFNESKYWIQYYARFDENSDHTDLELYDYAAVEKRLKNLIKGPLMCYDVEFLGLTKLIEVSALSDTEIAKMGIIKCEKKYSKFTYFTIQRRIWYNFPAKRAEQSFVVSPVKFDEPIFAWKKKNVEEPYTTNSVWIYRDVQHTWEINFEFHKDNPYKANIYPKIKNDDYDMYLTPFQLFQRAKQMDLQMYKSMTVQFKQPTNSLKEDDLETGGPQALSNDIFDDIEVARKNFYKESQEL